MTQGAPIGRYLLRERIARGGMGEVFRAVAVGSSGFEKPVIVKRVRPEHANEEAFIDLFIEEAKRMTLLAHPNIVQVLDFGVGDSGDYFLVLELVDGVDLARLAKSYARRGEPVPIAVALAVIQAVLRGLHHAHTQVFPDGVGLVHRDVSPGNVLLSKVGEVKVADFGVARVAVSAEQGKPSGLVGKIHYMPPEQFEDRDVDARADLFATAVTLFELLTGALPFDRGSVEAYRIAAKDGRFVELSSLRADAPPALLRVVATALAPDPSDRFESARAMAKALEAVATDGVAIASADDLADVVASAAALERDKPKRVVRLGAPPPDEGELTRATSDGRVVFTVRLSEPAPESATGGGTELMTPEPTLPASTPPSRGARWPAIALGLTVVVAAVFGATRLARSSFDTKGEAGSASPASTLAVPAYSAAVPATSAPEDAASVAPPDAPESARGPASPTWRRAPRVAPSSVAPASDCHGSVHLYAAAGWTVSGGPSVVQAPGRYDWPCGTFHLHAVSRADPKAVRDRGVTIRSGADAVFDLR